jgi:hypothetical protein
MKQDTGNVILSNDTDVVKRIKELLDNYVRPGSRDGWRCDPVQEL